VLLSNRSDPFCKQNELNTIEITKLLAGVGNGAAFQTKGGGKVLEAARIAGRSCWYVTVSYFDDSTRAKIEPHSPSVKYRLSLISDLVKMGNVVYAGVNPYVPEWIGDEDALIRALTDCGVYGVWSELLHFGRKTTLSDDDTAVMGEDVVRRAHKPADDFELGRIGAFMDKCRAAGLRTFIFGQAQPSDFWQPYYDIYKKGCLQNNQGFINHCFATLEDYKRVYFQDYFAFVTAGLTDKRLQIENYIRVHNRFLFFRKEKSPGKMTFKDVLRLSWKYPNVAFSLLRFSCFAQCVDDDSKPVLDDDGNPVLAFKRDGNFEE